MKQNRGGDRRVEKNVYKILFLILLLSRLAPVKNLNSQHSMGSDEEWGGVKDQ